MIKDILQGFSVEQPQPKIYQYKGKRIAVRLEPSFLRILDILAKENKYKTNQFVAELQDAHTGKNFSSFLRSLCMAETEKKLSSVDAMSHSHNLEFFMNNSPIPGLILSSDQTIIFANKSFFEWTGDFSTEIREKKFYNIFEIMGNQSIRELLNRIKVGVQDKALLSVTYSGKNIRLAGTAIFVPYADERYDRIYFIVWLKTTQSQRPARTLKIRKT